MLNKELHCNKQLKAFAFIGCLRRRVVTSSLSLSAQPLTRVLVERRNPAQQSLLRAAGKQTQGLWGVQAAAVRGGDAAGFHGGIH